MPWQLFGNGRNDWSAKLIRGLSAEAAAGFQSRRGRWREPTPVNPHYAAFATYKAAQFIALFGSVAAWPLGVHAQQPGKKVYRVGLLTNGLVIGATDERRKNLVSGLAAQGFVEGQNLIFEQRSADAQRGRLDGLIGELKAANVDVIVTFGYPPALAAKNLAGGIPVVVTGAGDPVATGLVDGLARPGGNLTGVTELSTDLSTK